MSKNIIDDFNLRAKRPLDKRELVDSLSEIDVPYEGLRTFQRSDSMYYRYLNGIFEQEQNFANLGIVTLKDFGAKGDGVTDDTNAIKQAILNSANKLLFVTAGTYKVTDTIIISNPIVIIGAGAGRTIFSFESMGGFTGKNGFEFSITTGKYKEYSIQNLSIKIKGGHGKNAIYTPKGAEIFNTYKPFFHFEKLKFMGDVESSTYFGLFDYGWKNYISIGDSRESIIRDVSVYGCYDYTKDPTTTNKDSTAFYLGSDSTGSGVFLTLIDHCFAHYCGNAIEFGYKVSNPKIVNSQFHRCFNGLYSPIATVDGGLYSVLELQASNLNINAQNRGIYFEKTAYVDMNSIRVTRADGGFNHSNTWYGYYFADVRDLKINQYRAYNEGSSYTNDHIGVYIVNGDFVNLTGGYFTGVSAGGLKEGITLKATTRIDIISVVFSNTVNGINFTSDSSYTPEVNIIGDKYTSSVTNKITYGALIGRNKISRIGKELNYGVIDDTLTALSSAGSTTLSVDTSDQIKRYQFNSGSYAYVYDINFSSTNAIEGDTFIIYLKVMGVNPTVNIKDETGATLLTINSATPQAYKVEMVYTGQNWRCLSANTSLI